MVELKRYLSKFKAPRLDSLPPFCGGAVGFIGYDCIKYLEAIPSKANDLPIDDAHLMLFKNIVAFDRVKDRLIIICNILSDEEPLEAGFERASREASQLLKKITEQGPLQLAGETKSVPTSRKSPTGIYGKAAYVDGVRKIKKHIRKGDIFQGVISDRFSLPISSSPFEIYRNLRRLCPSPYMFYLSMEDFVLLGASPEMLVRVNNGLVETCPIAGTRPRGETDAKDKKLERELLASVKEKAEHLMLVDLGRNDLGKVSRPGTVKVQSFMEVHRYSNVMHLVSLVQGKIKQKLSAWDAFFSCFPAGTLSGAPKIRAMEIISELEPTARGPYGGAVVYSDFSGSFDSCITIRSAVIHKNTAHVQAGAGIVADSRPDKEYEELLHKSLSIRNAIAQAESGVVH